MLTWYNVVKFVHVMAVIVWVGGVVTLAALAGRLADEADGAALRFLQRQGEIFGRRVQGPAVGIALLAGLVLMGMQKKMTFWMGWGLVALVVSMALDGAVLRRAGRELAHLATAPDADGQRLAALRRRVKIGTGLNILILVATVFVMIAKPTL